MLTKISAVTALFAAALNAVVLLGWWDLTADEVASLNAVIVAAGVVVHSWFNPGVPVGVKK